MSEEFSFEHDLAIDLDNLHEEWRMHPQIRKKYADELAHLEKVAKKAHEHVKVVRSRLIKEAKALKQPSADLREAHYREHKDHVDAKNKQIEAEYNLSMAWNAVKAFDDRKHSLENAVKLLLANYFAAPREERIIEPGKRIVDKARDETTQKGRAKVNDNRRRRTV